MIFDENIPDQPEDYTSIEKFSLDLEKYNLELVIKYFDLNKIYQFCCNNKVEVLVQSDGQYHCYINYKNGDGAWSIETHPLVALVLGIKSFEENNAASN